MWIKHYLFSSTASVDLSSALGELEQHDGRVWTPIYSLRREDTARLGFDNAAAWHTLLIAHQAELAEAMKIPLDKLRWYAAYHDAGHHPHIHMMLWSDDPKQGFLTKQGLTKMRSKLTNVIFKDEMQNLYQRKDLSYKEVTAAAKEALNESLRQMARADCNNPIIAQKLLELSRELESASGKKVYGYLKKPLKALVDSIVDELENSRRWRDTMTAGWIDAHAHLYNRAGAIGLDRDSFLPQGVTYVVEAGPAGPENFEDYLIHCGRKGNIQGRAYLNLAPRGLSRTAVS